MTGDVVGRHGCSGEDELPSLPPVIDLAPDVVPDRWLDLPLVDQLWGRPVQDQAGVQRQDRAGIKVGIQEDRAAGLLAGGLGLPAGLWPLNQDSACGGEPLR